MRRTPLKRKRGVRKVNPARRAKEWARAYGSLERVYYINNHLACAVQGCPNGQIQNAHVETGGTGRKADAAKVIPLCAFHHEMHHAGAETFVRWYAIDLADAARITDGMWTLYGADVVARAKADGRYARWLARDR